MTPLPYRGHFGQPQTMKFHFLLCSFAIHILNAEGSILHSPLSTVQQVIIAILYKPQVRKVAYVQDSLVLSH